MGSGFSLTCTHCGDTSSYMLGIGFAYGSLENVLGCVDRRRRARVQQELAEGDVVLPQYEHRLFACPRCDTLHTRFYVRLYHASGKTYETEFKCPRCRRVLVPAAREPTSYACARCGSHALEMGVDVMWD